jgi:hypothetical protein
MPIALLEWRSVKKNSLRGFAKIRIGKAMVVTDVTVNVSHGRRWASFPAKPIILADGTAKRDDKGKIVYIPLISWTDKETADKFSESVIQAVEREHPGATEE